MVRSRVHVTYHQPPEYAQCISSRTNRINISRSLKQTFRPLYSGPHQWIYKQSWQHNISPTTRIYLDDLVTFSDMYVGRIPPTWPWGVTMSSSNIQEMSICKVYYLGHIIGSGLVHVCPDLVKIQALKKIPHASHEESSETILYASYVVYTTGSTNHRMRGKTVICNGQNVRTSTIWSFHPPWPSCIILKISTSSCTLTRSPMENSCGLGQGGEGGGGEGGGVWGGEGGGGGGT